MKTQAHNFRFFNAVNQEQLLYLKAPVSNKATADQKINYNKTARFTNDAHYDLSHLNYAKRMQGRIKPVAISALSVGAVLIAAVALIALAIFVPPVGAAVAGAIGTSALIGLGEAGLGMAIFGGGMLLFGRGCYKDLQVANDSVKRFKESYLESYQAYMAENR